MSWIAFLQKLKTKNLGTVYLGVIPGNYLRLQGGEVGKGGKSTKPPKSIVQRVAVGS